MSIFSYLLLLIPKFQDALAGSAPYFPGQWLELVSKKNIRQIPDSNVILCNFFSERYVQITQWISLLYRRVQKIEQIKPDHCDRIKTTALKNVIEWHWSHTSE